MTHIKKLIAVGLLLALSGCIGVYEERGLCSYLGTCEIGNGGHMSADYCKELGSCSDQRDPTEYNAGRSGKSGSEASSSSDDGN